MGWYCYVLFGANMVIKSCYNFVGSLSLWLMVSYCDHWMSVVRRQHLLQTTSPPKLLAGF